MNKEDQAIALFEQLRTDLSRFMASSLERYSDRGFLPAPHTVLTRDELVMFFRVISIPLIERAYVYSIQGGVTREEFLKFVLQVAGTGTAIETPKTNLIKVDFKNKKRIKDV